MTEQERLLFAELAKDDMRTAVEVLIRCLEGQRTGQPTTTRVTSVHIAHQLRSLRIEATFGSEEEPC